MNANEFVSSLDNAKETPTGWSAACPIDSSHTISIRPGRKVNILASCSGGCAFSDLMRAVRMRLMRSATDDGASTETTQPNRDERLLSHVRRAHDHAQLAASELGSAFAILTGRIVRVGSVGGER